MSISGTKDSLLKTKPVILYVENDKPSIMIIKTLLNHTMGISETLTIIEETSNFMEKVRAIGVIPDIILMDIHILPYDGFELLTMIRADAKLRSCKVIALTASVMNEEVKELRESGFDGAISKPIDRYILPSLLEKVLNGQSVWHI